MFRLIVPRLSESVRSSQVTLDLAWCSQSRACSLSRLIVGLRDKGLGHIREANTVSCLPVE
jgi:hypothetical protein